jgi:hypothetical protein
MPYVIQSTLTWTDKKGTHTMVSYFKEHNNIVLPFNCMEGSPEKAKKYEFKTEANREKRKYFSARDNVKIIKV